MNAIRTSWKATTRSQVVLCDPSREMLDRAQRRIDEANLADRVSIVHAPIQELGSVLDQRFEVIACHAVLEWLADPQQTLSQLVPLLEPDGVLSLMFYNRNARLLKLILGGAFKEALEETRPSPASKGSPRAAVAYDESVVRSWLTRLDLRVRSKSGIRIFHDHVASEIRSRGPLDGLLMLESALRAQEPFASLGQHIQLVCERHTVLPA